MTPTHSRNTRKLGVTLLTTALLVTTLATINPTAGVAAQAASQQPNTYIATNTTRTNGHPLNGSVLHGKVAIWQTNPKLIKQVAFYLDVNPTNHKPTHIDKTPNFDLIGSTLSGRAALWDTTKTKNGTHTLYTITWLKNGKTLKQKNTFTIKNPTPPKPPVTPPADPNTIPNGNLPGWTQIFKEDFNQPAPLGAFLTTYTKTFGAYPAGWKDTSGNGTYNPDKTLSVKDGNLDIYLHSIGGTHYVSAPTPKLPTMLYGRYTIRFKSDPIEGYKTAWLLWPDDEKWPLHGEIDFPEGNLNQTINAYAHWANSQGGQDPFETTTSYTTWHTATTEWTPSKIVFTLDGKIIGTSTKDVPNTPMHWVIQTETQLNGGPPQNATQGHVQIAWVSAYSYTP
jgi:hypothetical protein